MAEDGKEPLGNEHITCTMHGRIKEMSLGQFEIYFETYLISFNILTLKEKKMGQLSALWNETYKHMLNNFNKNL